MQNKHTKINCISIAINKSSRNEIKQTTPFIILHGIIYLGIRKTKAVQDFYTLKIYKTLLKGIIKDINK